MARLCCIQTTCAPRILTLVIVLTFASCRCRCFASCLCHAIIPWEAVRRQEHDPNTPPGAPLALEHAGQACLHTLLAQSLLGCSFRSRASCPLWSAYVLINTLLLATIVPIQGVPAWWYSLQRGMNRLFANMEPERSWFRHNYSFSTTPTVESLGKSGRRNPYSAQNKPPEQLDEAEAFQFIKETVCHNVEFQTFRRLHHSNYIVFGIRQYADRCSALEEFPGCAASMAAAIRRKNTATAVRGLPKEISSKFLLLYLDNLAKRAGVPSHVPGVVDPTDRTNKHDGTVVGPGLEVADGRQNVVVSGTVPARL